MCEPLYSVTVWWPEFSNDFVQEYGICLRPDANDIWWIDATCAVRIDINADNCSLRSEIGSPHLEGAASRYADLEKEQWCVAILRQMPFVNIKVVMSLVDRTFGATEECSLHIVGDMRTELGDLSGL